MLNGLLNTWFALICTKKQTEIVHITCFFVGGHIVKPLLNGIELRQDDMDCCFWGQASFLKFFIVLRMGKSFVFFDGSLLKNFEPVFMKITIWERHHHVVCVARMSVVGHKKQVGFHNDIMIITKLVASPIWHLCTGSCYV